MDTRPIGVFDSGLGGLTTVRELRRIMPSENIVYFGDTGRVPYGTRSREIIRKYAGQDIRFLLSKDVKMVVVACNTATAALAGEPVSLSVPMVEAIAPAVRAAARATRNKRISVIGTSATVRSGAYERAFHALDPEFSVFTSACPLFVPLVENGFTGRDNPVTRLVAEQYLEPVRAHGADTLILGCTHYPILRELIADLMGPEVALIDSGAEAARAARMTLEREGMENHSGQPGFCRCYVSDSAECFEHSALPILGEADGLPAATAEQIDIESY